MIAYANYNGIEGRNQRRHDLNFIGRVQVADCLNQLVSSFVYKFIINIKLSLCFQLIVATKSIATLTENTINRGS